jgi:hypothetical protein
MKIGTSFYRKVFLFTSLAIVVLVFLFKLASKPAKDKDLTIEEVNNYLSKQYLSKNKTLDADIEKEKPQLNHNDIEIDKTMLSKAEEVDSRTEIKTQLNGLDKIRDWKSATFNRRLVFCTAAAKIANREVGAKVTAMEIHACIEEATRNLDVTNDLTISSIARLCVDEIRKL